MDSLSVHTDLLEFGLKKKVSIYHLSMYLSIYLSIYLYLARYISNYLSMTALKGGKY